MTTALLTGLGWILVYWAGAGTWGATGIAFALGFAFGLLALYRGWEEPLPQEAKGVIIHGEGRRCSVASCTTDA